MVAGLSRKKKSQAAYVEPLSDALAEFRAASRTLSEAIDRDAASFESVMAAYKLAQSTPEEQERLASLTPVSCSREVNHGWFSNFGGSAGTM
jgi:formiminotetrahydrofolate cyclodeaminase